MKKILIIYSLLLVAATGYSQSLFFCEKVTADGKPEKSSHVFRIGKEGGFFHVLAILDKPVNSTEVKMDVFRVDDLGQESFDATIKVNVQPDWVWFSKELTFYKGGDYTVYVYASNDRLLCTGMVKVILQ